MLGAKQIFVLHPICVLSLFCVAFALSDPGAAVQDHKRSERDGDRSEDAGRPAGL